MSWSVTATAATGSGARGKLSPCCSPAPASSTASSHDLAAAEILEQIEQEGDLGLVAPGLALPPGGVRYWSCSVKNTRGGEVLGWVKGLGVPQRPKFLSACGKTKRSRDAFFLQREILKIALNLLGFMHISGLTDCRGSV